MKYIQYLLVLALLMSTGIVKAAQPVHPKMAVYAMNNCVVMGEYADGVQRLRAQFSTFTLKKAKEVNDGEEHDLTKRETLNLTADYIFTFSRFDDPVLVSNYVIANCIRAANQIVQKGK